MNLSGTLSGDILPGITNHQVVVRLIHAGQAQVWVYRDPGAFALRLHSNAYVHGNSAQTFHLEVISLYRVSTVSLPERLERGGNIDFGHTLEVVGVDLRDATGTLMAGNEIISESGAIYNVVAVPEPKTTSLLLGAMAALLGFRRNQGRNIAAQEYC